MKFKIGDKVKINSWSMDVPIAALGKSGVIIKRYETAYPRYTNKYDVQISSDKNDWYDILESQMELEEAYK